MRLLGDLLVDMGSVLTMFCVSHKVQPSLIASKSENHLWSSVFTHRLRKGCPCQDLLQPCGHKETVDSSLEIFSLQSFILALVLLDDDIARSAVTVEGDRADRDLSSLRSLKQFTALSPRTTVFSGLTRLSSLPTKFLIETRAQRRLHCDV